jgi:hypothetical protein
LAKEIVGTDTLVAGAGRRPTAAQFVVGRVSHETVREQEDALLDPLAQMLADTPSLLDGASMVLFAQAIAGI